jgi:hypothetical protein
LLSLQRHPHFKVQKLNKFILLECVWLARILPGTIKTKENYGYKNQHENP